MKILLLQLVNNHRLSLNQLNNITYKPDKRIQLILGTNGSGKSSILEELSPIPADLNSDYLEDGFKLIHIQHLGNFYKLKSIKNINKHSFIKNDTEMNSGGTRRVQLQLVKEEFNFTPFIHEVILGKKSLSNMTIAERKSWLTLIGDVDYDYVMSVFKDLSKRQRDIVGALKIANNKLTKEKENTLSDADKNMLQKERKEIIRLIEDSISRKNIDAKLHSKSNMGLLDKQVRECSNLISKFQVPLPIKNLESKITELKTKASLEINSIQSLEKEYKDLKNTKPKDIYNLKDLIKQKNGLLKEIDTYDKDNLNVDLNSIEFITRGFNNSMTDVISCLNEVEHLHAIKFSSTDLEITTNKIMRVDKFLIGVEKEININSGTYNSIKDKIKNPEVECDKCGNKFTPGIANLSRLENKIDELVKEKDQLLVIKQTYMEKLEKQQLKSDSLSRLKRIISDDKEIEKVWTLIFKGITFLQPLVGIESKIFLLSKQLNNLLLRSKLEGKLKPLEEQIEISKLYSENDQKKIDDKLFDLENKIIKGQKILRGLKIELKNYTQRMTETTTLMSLRTTLESTLGSLKLDYDINLNSIINRALNSIITNSKIELVKIENTLQNESLVNDRKNQILIDIRDLKERKNVLDIMIDHLSPTNGLIAKSIQSFLVPFTKDINRIVSKIWTYDLELKPFKVDGNRELDYKFPLMVGGKIREDVKDGSRSIQEVIDLAFKIVSMEKLGLGEYPLFLDEFGSSFDHTHRNQAFNVLGYLEKSNFGQVFMVSHFENFYGSFEDGDVVVLSEDNILLSEIKKYNEVIKIK